MEDRLFVFVDDLELDVIDGITVIALDVFNFTLFEITYDAEDIIIVVFGMGFGITYK